MKVAFVAFAALAILAGASASPVETNSIEWPEWIADLIDRFPESLPEIIDQLPQIIEALPEIVAAIRDHIEEMLPIVIDALPEIIETIRDRLEEVVAIIIDRLPQIIESIREIIPIIIERLPELRERLNEAIDRLIERIPEIVPIIWERIFYVADRIPDIYTAIRDVLLSLDLPEWFPEIVIPEWETPEWWPEETPELPELPEINQGVAGVRADIETVPGIVQIELGYGPIWVQECAGTVLTSLHVLSTARCFSGARYDPRFRRVRAGSSTRYTGGAVLDVASALIHPSFGEDGFDGDVAIVRLASSLVFSPAIQQLPIITQGFILPSGLSVTTAGWGNTAEGSRFSDRELYAIDLQVSDRDLCAARWVGTNSPFTITPNMICAGQVETGGRNSDLRDRGSPLIYDNILVGLVSWGAPIGNQFFPVVATSISSYTEWIVENAA